MTFDPIAADLAVRAARATAGSARPDAPVVPDRPARTRPTVAARSRVAARPARPRPLGGAGAAPYLPARVSPAPAGATRDTGSPMAKVTLQSIADRVGVSRMTVSNAFSRPDQLSADLRARILTAADELGYVGPDPAARALARGRTGAVGLLINGSLSEAFEDAVSAEFLASVADALAGQGMALTLLPSSTDQTFVPARDVAVDGALVYICDPTSPDIGWLERRNIPVVVVDHNVRDGVASVNVDDRGGARLAAQHLVELGHRRIGDPSRSTWRPTSPTTPRASGCSAGATPSTRPASSRRSWRRRTPPRTRRTTSPAPCSTVPTDRRASSLLRRLRDRDGARRGVPRSPGPR